MCVKFAAVAAGDAMGVMNITKVADGASDRPDRKPIGLALQGGGSWGAFTWGALDALLDCPELVVSQLSGCSAGAINAAIVASALAKGSPASAKAALASFWRRIADPVVADLMRVWMGPVGRYWRNSLGDWMLASSAFGLHGVRALGLNPLREVVADHVDIQAIRSKSAPGLFVTVTNIRSGLPRVISNEAMSIDVLLASACLPHLFPPVELDGEHYWDGGYAANPTIWPMIGSGLAGDLVLIQLAPDRIDFIPKDARSIRRRVAEIVFNSSLVAEMQTLAALRELPSRGCEQPCAPKIRLHRIGPPDARLFQEGSGVDRGQAWLRLLRDEGFAAGRRFAVDHTNDIGVRETLRIERVYFDRHNARMTMAPGTA